MLLRALLVRPTQAWQDWYCGRAKYQFWVGNDVSTIGAVTSKFVRSVDPQRVRRMGTMALHASSESPGKTSPERKGCQLLSQRKVEIPW
jgi:hypothetical protein